MRLVNCFGVLLNHFTLAHFWSFAFTKLLLGFIKMGNRFIKQGTGFDENREPAFAKNPYAFSWVRAHILRRTPPPPGVDVLVKTFIGYWSFWSLLFSPPTYVYPYIGARALGLIASSSQPSSIRTAQLRSFSAWKRWRGIPAK